MRLIIIIAIIVSTVLSGTYAYLQIVASENTASTVAGCFDVNYHGEVVSNSLVSTNNYLEGHHTQITLSRNENCEIYTEATIYLHTTQTTAPINGEKKALKYKIKQNGTELTKNLDETSIDGIITTTTGDEALITIPLTDTATDYDIYIWIAKDISQGTYNGTTYSGYIYATSNQTSTIKN